MRCATCSDETCYLGKLGIDVGEKQLLLQELKESDTIKLSEEFTSVYKIQKVVQTNPAFKYVSPQQKKIVLPPKDGSSEQKVIKYQFIPVSETLKHLLEDPGFDPEASNRSSEDGLLKDVKDGRAYRDNPFFQKYPDAFTLILVSDDFELANPLGARRGYHKVNNTYWTIAEIPKHQRYWRYSIFQSVRTRNLMYLRGGGGGSGLKGEQLEIAFHIHDLLIFYPTDSKF